MSDVGRQEAKGQGNLAPEADYLFHIFISYRRVPKLEEWVRGIFKEELTERLRECLGGEEPIVFCDDKAIPAGAKWPQRIADGLRTSRCLLPVWTPSYFKSDWCLAELETFLRREELIGGRNGLGLIIPVIWHPVPALLYPRLQHSVAQTQARDFTRFTFTGSGFTTTALHVEFQQEVIKFAQDVAEAVRNAPEFRADWPVLTPDNLAGGMPPPRQISRQILTRKTA